MTPDSTALSKRFSALAFVAALTITPLTAPGASVIKANNLNALNLGSSWVGGVAPGAADIAVWNGSSAIGTFVLGSDVTWRGIYISNSTSGSLTFTNAAGTINTLSLGAGGLNFAVSSRSLNLQSAVLIMTNQTWTLGGSDGLVGIGSLSGTNQTLTLTGSSGSYWNLKGSGSNFRGTINYGLAARLQLQGGYGTWGNATINLTAATALQANGLNGTVIIGDLTTSNANAAIGGAGSSAQNGTVTYQVGGLGKSSTWAGKILDGNGPTSLIKLGGGSWNLTGSNSFSGGISVSGGSLLVNNSTGSGTGSGDVFLGAGTSLGGTGVIAGSVFALANSSVTPGPGSNRIGTLTIRGTVDLGGTTALVLNRTNGQNCSRLAGADSVHYGGLLSVINVGPPLQPGDSFQLFSATNYTGAFDSLSLPELSAGLAWSIPSLSINGRLTIGQKPSLTVAPSDQVVNCGGQAAFSVAASGTAPLTYQWSVNGVPVPAATNATFVFSNVPPAQSNYIASVRVDNSYGSISTSATLSLADAVEPVIVSQPQSRTNATGTVATFVVAADSCGPLNYQWFTGAMPLAGQTNQQLILYNVQYADAAPYEVRVSNSAGSVTSAVAQLVVVAPSLAPNTLVLENARLRLLFNTNTGLSTILDKHTGGEWNQVRWTVPEGFEQIRDRRFEEPLGTYWNTGHGGVSIVQAGVSAILFQTSTVYATTNDGTPHLSRLQMQQPLSLDRKTHHLRFRSLASGLRNFQLNAIFSMFDSNGVPLGTVSTNVVFGATSTTDADWVERELWIPSQLIPPNVAQANVIFDLSAGTAAEGSLSLTDVRLIGGNLVPYPGFTSNWGWSGWTGMSIIDDPAATPDKVLKVEAALIDPAHAYNRQETSIYDYSSRTYRVSFRYKAVGLKNLTVKARHNGVFPDRNLVFGSTAVTSNWTEYSYFGTTTNEGRLSFYFDFVPASGAAGEFYMTDAEIVPIETGPVHLPIMAASQKTDATQIQYTFNTRERIKQALPALTCTLDLGASATNLNEVVWKLIGDTNQTVSTLYAAPAFFPASASPSVQWLIPTGEGVLLPGTDIFDDVNRQVNPSGGNKLRPWTHMMPMAFHGAITPAGDGYYMVNDTPVSTEIIYKNSQVTPQRYAYLPFITHLGSKGKLQYHRKVSTRFVAQGTGYVGIAKDYLANYAIPKGYHVTYAQKALLNPLLPQYVGMPRLAAASSKAVELAAVADLKAAGIHRATFTTTNPDVAALAQTNGWMTSRYDNYWDSIHPIFEANDWLKRDANGNVTDTGWGTPEDPLYICCPAFIEQVARQDIPVWNQNLNHRTWFIDVFGTVGPYTCYATNHPANELDTIAARTAISRYVTEELGMVFWTEGAAEYLVPYASYGEGCMTAYGVGLVAPKYRIPLWSLVYHDCWENSWHTWGGNINTAYGWKANDLWNILYGSKQLLGFTDWSSSSSYYYAAGFREKVVESIAKVTHVTRRVGLQAMTEHRFLSADGNVQRTRYADGTEVYVNFGSTPFSYENLTIPAEGHLMVADSSAAATSAYQIWRDANFTPDEVAAGSGEPTAEPAGDGLSNYTKFAFGISNPKQRAEPNWSISAALETGLRFSFVRAQPNLHYRVQTSVDLVNWDDYEVNPGQVGEQVVVTVPVQPGVRTQFARFRVGE